VSDVTNILLCGVGGQGILLASRMISTVALRCGLDVKSADVHGMAQRGGSVTSQLRMGAKVYSPVIPTGEADCLVALEKLEALRCAHLVRPKARAFIGNAVLQPVSVSIGLGVYPPDIDARLREVYHEPVLIDALAAANELGNPRVSNVVLLGALSTSLPFDLAAWEACIRELIKPSLVDVNLQAFHRGRGFLKS